MTLIELLVVVTILGISAGAATLTFRRPAPRVAESSIARVSEVRRAAVRSGRIVRDSVRLDSSSFDVTALPDGSVLVDSVTSRIERLTGKQIRNDHQGAAEHAR